MSESSEEEVIERHIQILGEKVLTLLPDDVHFLLVAYRAKEGRLFLTWSGNGTPEDRANAARELHAMLKQRVDLSPRP